MSTVHDTSNNSNAPRATATISVDGKEVAKGRIEKTILLRITLDEGFDVGEDTGTPVSTSNDVPFKFAGMIEKVTVELK